MFNAKCFVVLDCYIDLSKLRQQLSNLCNLEKTTIKCNDKGAPKRVLRIFLLQQLC